MTADLARFVRADLKLFAHQIRLGFHGDDFLLQGFQLSYQSFLTVTSEHSLKANAASAADLADNARR
jgi:hypothetical protein